jgi:serine/threonine protein kinase
MVLESIGKYINLQPLGRGGMAEVYLGFDSKLERRVAIKVIHPHLASEPSFEERFLREARLIASLEHPSIVHIYEFDIHEGQPYMVMEHLPGGTLRDRLRQHNLMGKLMPQAEIISLLEPLAGALDFAHHRGAVHRDIKPANILFSQHGDPVIVDFGIAKILDESIQLTQTGGVVGSPHYLSPEQASSKPITRASDIYSFGIVLYELAAGRVPFQGDTVTGILMQHLTDPPPPPRQINPDLSPEVEAVILQALVKDPQDRYPSAGAMIRALRQAAPLGEPGGVSLDADTVMDSILEDSLDQEPSSGKIPGDKRGTQESAAPASDESYAAGSASEGVMTVKRALSWKGMVGGSLGLLAVLVVFYLVFSNGLGSVFGGLFQGENSDILLHATLDDPESILTPEIGIGGRYVLEPADFVPGKQQDGILFVRSGGEECENQDFQEVSFPTYQGKERNINMEAGELSFWFQPQFDPTDMSGVYQLAAITSEGGTPPFISLEFFDGQLLLIIEDEAENWYQTNSNIRAPLWQPGDWVYIRAVWDTNDDQDSLRLYVDTQRVDAGQQPGGWQIDDIDTNIRVNIGSNSPCGYPVANGIIDEVIIRR